MMIATRFLPALLPFVLLATQAHAVDVTSCGQAVPARQVGTLIADLDCPAGQGVTLGRRARLELAGFVLSSSNADGVGVRCHDGPCAIVGPGRIDGFGLAVFADRSGRIVVTGITLDGSSLPGGAGSTAITAIGQARPDLTDVTIINHDDGVMTGSVARINGVLIDGSGSAAIVAGTAVMGKHLTVVNSGVGVIAKRISLTDLQATGNSAEGVRATRVLRLVDSVVTGNDGLGQGVDIRALRRPRLTRTTCERSAQIDTGLPLGVCSED